MTSMKISFEYYKEKVRKIWGKLGKIKNWRQLEEKGESKRNRSKNKNMRGIRSKKREWKKKLKIAGHCKTGRTNCWMNANSLCIKYRRSFQLLRQKLFCIFFTMPFRCVFLWHTGNSTIWILAITAFSCCCTAAPASSCPHHNLRQP